MGMVYMEIKERNNRKYFYRVISIREGKKVKKRRIYLGVNVDPKLLLKREKEADENILNKKRHIAHFKKEQYQKGRHIWELCDRIAKKEQRYRHFNRATKKYGVCFCRLKRSAYKNS